MPVAVVLGIMFVIIGILNGTVKLVHDGGFKDAPYTPVTWSPVCLWIIIGVISICYGYFIDGTTYEELARQSKG